MCVGNGPESRVRHISFARRYSYFIGIAALVGAVSELGLWDGIAGTIAKLIWRTASPNWNFDDATFERSAKAFDNPDHVAIVIHNYRWRLGLAEGEARYDDFERRLAQLPIIVVSTVTMEGDANGAPHPESAAYATRFAGRYVHRLVQGGSVITCPRRRPRDSPMPSSKPRASPSQAVCRRRYAPRLAVPN